MRKYIDSYIGSIAAFIGRTPSTPANMAPNTERNQKTIEALIAAGSNLDKPHHIEHHVYCYSRELLSGLTAKGSALGYRVARIGNNDHEGARSWYADLVKETPLNLESINEENSRLLKLVVEFKGRYEGWGTKVVL